MVVVGVPKPGVTSSRPDPADDGHPVPAAVAVVGRLVAERGERSVGEGGVGLLGLLQAEHVGLVRTRSTPRPGACRAVSELTFQVAMRIGPAPPVDDHEEQVGLAGQLVRHRGPPVARAGPGRQAVRG